MRISYWKNEPFVLPVTPFHVVTYAELGLSPASRWAEHFGLDQLTMVDICDLANAPAQIVTPVPVILNEEQISPMSLLASTIARDPERWGAHGIFCMLNNWAYLNETDPQLRAFHVVIDISCSPLSPIVIEGVKRFISDVESGRYEIITSIDVLY